MKIIRILSIVVCVATITSCSTMKKTVATGKKPVIENLSSEKLTISTSVDYSVFLPKQYKKSSTNKWPLILFLHGSGERGTNIWRTAIHGPVNYIAKHPDFPFILVTPQCPAGSKWSDDLLMGLLDEVTKKYSVDTNRIYLTGLSMGGYGTWSLATTYPERFAAVAPICGGEGSIGIILSMMETDKSAALKTLPIWAFHGVKDTVVPIEETERMVKLLKKIGNENVEFTKYPEATHNSWTVTYDNPELYQWFLEHDLKTRMKTTEKINP